MAKPRFYETFYIVRPDISEEELEKIQEKLASIISNNSGEVLKSEKWAERKLAYKIQHITKGIYYILISKALPSVAAEIEKAIRSFPTDVLRFITVVLTEEEALKSIGAARTEEAVRPKSKDKKNKNLIVKKRYGRIRIDKLTAKDINYKNVDLLSHFITERKKIVPRRSSGLSAYGQRLLSNAIKTARIMALLPFTVLHN